MKDYTRFGLVIGLVLGSLWAWSALGVEAIEMDACEEFMGVWGSDYTGPLLNPAGHVVGHADSNGVTFYDRSPRGWNAVDEEAEELSRIDLEFDFNRAVHAIAMCRVELREELEKTCAEEIQAAQDGGFDAEVELGICTHEVIVSSRCFERIYGEKLGERA